MEPLEEDVQPSDDTFYLVSSPRPIPAPVTPEPPAAATTPGNTQQEPARANGPFVEDEPPRSNETVGLSTPQTVDETVTRHRLALGMLWMVGLVAGFPTLALMATRWTHFTTDQYKEVSLVFTPIVALTSAAFGFFFASDERDRNRRF